MLKKNELRKHITSCWKTKVRVQKKHKGAKSKKESFCYDVPTRAQRAHNTQWNFFLRKTTKKYQFYLNFRKIVDFKVDPKTLKKEAFSITFETFPCAILAASARHTEETLLSPSTLLLCVHCLWTRNAKTITGWAFDFTFFSSNLQSWTYIIIIT